MKRYFSLLIFSLLLLSCSTKEASDSHSSMPEAYIGKWAPESDDNLCDRYIEFADGQCYTYISPYQGEFLSGNIYYNVGFSLLDARFCHLSNGNPPHLILGNKDIGTAMMLKEGENDILILDQVRYRRVKGLYRESGARFGRVVIPDSLKTHFMEVDTRYPMVCDLYAEGANQPIDPQTAQRYLVWISLDESIAIVSENGLVLAKAPGEVTIKVVTVGGHCADACTVIVGGGDLSENGPANCYIVPASGKYTFTPTKGNSRESIGDDIARVRLSWETFNLWADYPNDPNNEHVVIPTSVKLTSDKQIAFEVPSPIRNGNALIEAYGPDNHVIWSWHIWVCQNYNPTRQAQVYANNAGVVMDRNLGALSTEPGNVLTMGLLYQWGRKDPFVGAGHYATPSPQSQTIEKARVGVDSDANPWFKANRQTLEGSIQNPTCFYYDGEHADEDSHNWCSNGSDTFWNETKTIYDPCPAGWKVLSSSVFSKAIPHPDPTDRHTLAFRYLPHFALNGSSLTSTSSKIVFPLTAAIIYKYTDGSNAGDGAVEYKYYTEDSQGLCLSAIWCDKSVEGHPGCAETVRLSFDPGATGVSDDKSSLYWADRQAYKHPLCYKDVGNAVRCMME